MTAPTRPCAACDADIRLRDDRLAGLVTVDHDTPSGAPCPGSGTPVVAADLCAGCGRWIAITPAGMVTHFIRRGRLCPAMVSPTVKPLGPRQRACPSRSGHNLPVTRGLSSDGERHVIHCGICGVDVPVTAAWVRAHYIGHGPGAYRYDTFGVAS